MAGIKGYISQAKTAQKMFADSRLKRSRVGI